MKRLVRDAALIGLTAAAVWFVRGDATQQAPEVTYGSPVQIVCTEGRIDNAMASGAALDRVSLFWRPWAGPESLRGLATLNGCAIYPVLESTT